MAVTLTAAQVAEAIRADSNDADVLRDITRLIRPASALILRNAPAAPDDIHNEALIRLVGYLWDAPFVPSVGRTVTVNALAASGATALLSPWRSHRAGVVGATADAAARGVASGNPLVGVDLDGNDLTFTYQDTTTETLTLPAPAAPAPGGAGLTAQQARELAEAVAFRAAFITDTALGSERKQLAVSNAGYATGIAVPAARAERTIRVTVFDGEEADATFTFPLADLLAKPSVSGAPTLDDSDSVSGAGDSGNIYRIARSAGGHFVTGGDTVGTFRYAFVQEDIDATALVSGIPTNAAIDGRADARVVAGTKAWARTGGPVIPADQLVNAPGGLDEAAVKAEIASFARVDEPTERAPASRLPVKLQEVLAELAKVGWLDEGATAAEDAFVRESPAAAKYGTGNVAAGTWEASVEQSPRLVNRWVAIRVPTERAAEVEAGDLRLRVAENAENTEISTALSTDWEAVGAAAIGNYRYYQVQVADLPVGGVYRVQRFEPYGFLAGLTAELRGVQVGGDQAVKTLNFAGDIPALAVAAGKATLTLDAPHGDFFQELLDGHSQGLYLPNRTAKRTALLGGFTGPSVYLLANPHGVVLYRVEWSVAREAGNFTISQSAPASGDAFLTAVNTADAYAGAGALGGSKIAGVRVNGAGGAEAGWVNVYLARDSSAQRELSWYMAFEPTDGGAALGSGTVTARVSLTLLKTDAPVAASSGGGLNFNRSDFGSVAPTAWGAARRLVDSGITVPSGQQWMALLIRTYKQRAVGRGHNNENDDGSFRMFLIEEWEGLLDLTGIAAASRNVDDSGVLVPARSAGGLTESGSHSFTFQDRGVTVYLGRAGAKVLIGVSDTTYRATLRAAFSA